MVREKSLENENFLSSVKSQGFQFQSGKLTRNDKSREFKNFPKKLIVNSLLKSIVSLNHDKH